jgi:Tol biopolymer transport system component
MPLNSGTRLGPYEIVAPLGAGGMGEVYRAQDSRLGRDVALKVLPAGVASDPARQQRFETEARAVAALNHPNIVAIYDVALQEQPAFIVSELVSGETLRGVIQRGPVLLKKVLDIAVQIADGLAAAHAAGIAHRDLKPDNIMLTPEGRVKILDFGLAKSISRAAGHADATRTIAATEPGTIVGTASYMSPEQASGSPEVDGRSDQFSLGLIIQELITGNKAFERPTAAETMAAIIREDPAALPATVPLPLRWSLERCLAKDPGQRYDTTRDLFLELRQLRDHASEISAVAAATSPSGSALPSQPARRRRWAATALVAGLIIGFAIAALWLEAPLATARYVPFATEAGIQTMPAWSPGGDRIAYSGEVNGVFQIFVRKIGSPAPTQITRQDASSFDPFWSPDGSRIYYIVSRGETDESLWSSAVAGGAAEKVLDGLDRAAISPDGKTLAVEALQPDKTYLIMLSSPPGAPPRPLPQSSIPALRSALHVGTSMQFTRDGKYLGVLTNGSQKPELWKVPMNGGAAEELLRGHYIPDAQPLLNWFSDGSIIWSWTSSQGDAHVVETDFRHGKDRQITSGTGQEKYAVISPDDRTLAFQAGDSGYGLFEVPLDGSPPSRVVTTDRHEVAPSWAPDGAHFAYVTDRNGHDEIWLRNRTDGSERRIVSTLDFPHSSDGDLFLDCAISPDGSRVAYRYDTGSRISIWISSLAGDTPVPLYDDPEKALQRGPSWSPDGNSMAYYSVRDGKPAVVKIRVGASRPPDLVTYVATPTPVRWSPQGDWIAWDDAGKLTLISPDGKQRRIVSQKQWFTYGWSKEGDAVLGVGLSENRHLFIGRIDATSEHETTVADLGPAPAVLNLCQHQSDFPYRGFTLHPDGKSFLTSALGIKGDIWLLENFDAKVGLLDRVLHRR